MTNSPRVLGPAMDPRVRRQPEATPNLPATPDWPAPSAFGYGPDIGTYRELMRELMLVYAPRVARNLPREFTLVPYRLNKQLEVVQRDNGDIVCLDATTPRSRLEFEFTVNAFIQRVTATVRGVRLTAQGQPEPGVVQVIDQAAYIQVDLSYAGRSDQFISGEMPLSELAGLNASYAGAYYFSALPWVPKGTNIDAACSILEPTFATPTQTPAFVRSVAGVSISFDTVRIPEVEHL